MTCILNVQEAFNALQNGKTVLCRYAGDGTLPGDKDFSPLDHMPATVFAMPHYEFCIKLEMMELAGISFTKPLKLDEYQDGQEVYVICTYAPSIYVMNFKTAALVESINSGFVQQDAENAKLQLKAISKALGHELNGEISVTRLGNEAKKTKRKKEPEAKITAIDDEVKETLDKSDQEKTFTVTKDDQCQLVIDAINVCDSNSEIEAVLHNLDEYQFNEDQLDLVENARKAKSSQFVKTESIEKNKNHTGITIIEQGPISTAEDSLLADPINNNLVGNHLELLNDLIDRASKAQSPAEANSVFQHTKGWTQEQTAPLHAAVSRRLSELLQPEIKEPPSLLVRIQNASDLTELDALELEVSGRDQLIQKALMDEVKKRRAQINKFQPAFIEDLP
ncbi:hypothetical protein ACG9Z8_06520 [Acinetobacter ursingii]|uniref:hypothetical protein n=1 Tax=Acinetobacter ursingii TaxID=108980 RepID=UPI003AF5ED01